MANPLGDIESALSSLFGGGGKKKGQGNFQQLQDVGNILGSAATLPNKLAFSAFGHGDGSSGGGGGGTAAGFDPSQFISSYLSNYDTSQYSLSPDQIIKFYQSTNPAALKTQDALTKALQSDVIGKLNLQPSFASQPSSAPNPLAFQMMWQQTVAPYLNRAVSQLQGDAKMFDSPLPKNLPADFAGVEQTMRPRISADYQTLADTLGASAAAGPQLQAIMSALANTNKQVAGERLAQSLTGAGSLANLTQGIKLPNAPKTP